MSNIVCVPINISIYLVQILTPLLVQSLLYTLQHTPPTFEPCLTRQLVQIMSSECQNQSLDEMDVHKNPCWIRFLTLLFTASASVNFAMSPVIGCLVKDRLTSLYTLVLLDFDAEASVKELGVSAI